MRFMANAELADLATLYIGLAKGADDQFHFRELDVIEHLLTEWKDLRSESTITDILEQVLMVFDAGKRAWDELVETAVRRLGARLNDDEKRRVLSDLTRIGLADRRFMHSEAAFIHRVSRAWKIQPLHGLSETWSILGSGGIQGEALRALGLLYLSIAYYPSHEFTEEERESILGRLGQWVPDASAEDIELAFRDSLAVFATQPPNEIVESSLTIIRRLVPEHQHKTIYDDLDEIARSDRVFSVEEGSWLARLGRALGLGRD